MLSKPLLVPAHCRRLHASKVDLMQQQIAVANAQTKELLDLSANIAVQTLKSVNATVTKTFEQLSK